MDNVIIEVLKENEIGEYSELINEVMEEFNSEEINRFQKWFVSVEGIIFRREAGFDDGSFDTVQFAAKYEGKIIGAFEVENQHHIQSFFIKKEFQNKGIGKMLLNYSIAFFNEKQLSLISYKVLSSDYAINIYKSLGFEGEGKILYLEIERPEEEGYHYFVFPKDSKWVIRLDGKLPWQEEAGDYDDKENVKSA